MSGRFVRASKYRHVYGQEFKKELCYENLKPTLSAFDSNLLQCNGKYIALNAAGIGSIIVIPVNETGKEPEKVPMFRGHSGGSVMDTDFDPFDESRFCSSGEDGKILLWKIPKDYTFAHADSDNIQDVKPVGELVGHSRKVGHVKFSPVSSDVLASSAFDYTVRIWNVATKKTEVVLKHKDLVTSFCWNYNGTKIATVSRDKKVRVWDARKGEIISEGPGHPGAKNARIVWLGNTERLLTTGFDRFSERQLAIWDAEKIDAGAIGGFYPLDSSSGILMPFYDPSTGLVFVAGKGDGNIRYYEFADDKLYEISEYPSTSPQRGLAVSPKRFVKIKENEILRAYKLLNDNSIEPVSFIVPRRSEMFQDDIYPDAPAGIAAQTAEEFFAGKTVDGPTLVSMQDIYDGKANPTTKTAAQEEKEVSAKKAEEAEEKAKEEKAAAASAATPAPSPVKKTAAAAASPPEPSAALTHSQEQGVDNMLKGKKVDSLLDKVNNMSDDDTQAVDSDNNEDWEPETSKSEESKKDEKKKEGKVEGIQKDIQKDFQKDIAKDAKKDVQKTAETHAKKETKTELKTLKKETKELKKEISKETPASHKTSGGLKATVEKLQALVIDLEHNVTKLAEQNASKDNKLQSLEEKLNLLLEKQK